MAKSRCDLTTHQHIHTSAITAKEYIILGGQHFIRALKELRAEQLKTKKESELPESLKFVEMEVLQQGASYGLRAYMAGQHQATQSLTESCSLSDFFGLCLDAALAKKWAAMADAQQNAINRKLDRIEPPPPGHCVFEFEEIWVLLVRSGMRTEDHLTDPLNKPNMCLAEVQELQKLKVSTYPIRNFSRHREKYFSRNREKYFNQFFSFLSKSVEIFLSISREIFLSMSGEISVSSLSC